MFPFRIFVDSLLRATLLSAVLYSMWRERVAIHVAQDCRDTAKNVHSGRTKERSSQFLQWGGNHVDFMEEVTLTKSS